MSLWYRRTPEGWLLVVHAQPGAKKTEVVGLHGTALKIRVAMPPLEGRANAALAAFIAGELGVPKKSVSVVKGGTSRHKTVLVEATGADPSLLLKTGDRPSF